MNLFGSCPESSMSMILIIPFVKSPDVDPTLSLTEETEKTIHQKLHCAINLV